MRRTFPTEPVEPTEPAPPLSQKVKGRHAPRANPHRSVFRFSHLSFHAAAQNDEWRSPTRRHPERSERKMCACLRQNSCRLSRRISCFPSACKILRLSSHRSVFRFSHLSFHTAAQNDEWRSPTRRHPERSERKMCACLRQNSCHLARRISRFPSTRKILRLSSHRSVFCISHLSFHAAQNDEWRSPPRRHPERSEWKMCA